MASDSVTAPESPTLRLLLQAQSELSPSLGGAAAARALSKPLVVEEAEPSLLPLPYKARLNNLLAHLLSAQANEEAKAGERHTEETIEKVKQDLRIHAATHPKLQPLVEILLASLPSHATSPVIHSDPRPVEA